MTHSNYWPPFKNALIGVLMIALTGCASTYYGAATFKSTPDGVQVFDMEDGSVIGITPVSYVWRSDEARRKYMNMRMHKEGYQDAVKAFWLPLDFNNQQEAYGRPQLIEFELIKAE